jgi:hypothetical protein
MFLYTFIEFLVYIVNNIHLLNLHFDEMIFIEIISIIYMGKFIYHIYMVKFGNEFKT